MFGARRFWRCLWGWGVMKVELFGRLWGVAKALSLLSSVTFLVLVSASSRLDSSIMASSSDFVAASSSFNVLLCFLALTGLRETKEVQLEESVDQLSSSASHLPWSSTSSSLFGRNADSSLLKELPSPELRCITTVSSLKRLHLLCCTAR